MSKQRISTSDWHDEWSWEHQVRVTFVDGETKYLSIPAALARLSAQWTPDNARRYLVDEGQELVTWTGAHYYMATEPVPA